MDYLVTGGAGFIGSHLIEALISCRHNVRALDNLSNGRIENLPREVDLVIGDVTKPEVVRSALDGVDGCFHLAAIASVEQSQRDWQQSHTVNLGGTIAVLEAVRHHQTRRGRLLPVVYASSAAVYGNCTEIPISERAVTHPESAYAVDKLSCELHAAVASKVYGLSTVGLRFFNIYGPRQDPNSPYSGVISIFCSRMSRREPLEIYGDGAQVRDFVYVDDAVTALRCAMDAVGPIPEVFNVCTGVGTSIASLGEVISQVLEMPFSPRFAPARAGDVRVSIGDPRRAQHALAFSARTPLEQGLARTLASLAG